MLYEFDTDNGPYLLMYTGDGASGNPKVEVIKAPEGGKHKPGATLTIGKPTFKKMRAYREPMSLERTLPSPEETRRQKEEVEQYKQRQRELEERMKTLRKPKTSSLLPDNEDEFFTELVDLTVNVLTD